MTNNKILVGLSGGIDSTVTCLLLLITGYDVSSLYMKMWDNGDSEPCTYKEDMMHATNACNTLGIKLYIHNFYTEYNNKVFKKLISGYVNGKTPNPDVLCNKKVKFNCLFTYAQTLGIKKIATGHYGAKKNKTLEKAYDTKKDQTYFLCLLSRIHLGKTLFPLANYYKKQVRKIAFLTKLSNYTKKDSFGVCFIQPKKFNIFIGNYIKKVQGNILNIHKTIIGTHNGISFYTIGQRITKEITKKETYIVIGKNKKKNTLTVARDNVSILVKYIPTRFVIIKTHIKYGVLYCNVKTQSQQKEVGCYILSYKKKQILILYKNTKLPATSQIIAMYHNSICLGGSTVMLPLL